MNTNDFALRLSYFRLKKDVSARDMSLSIGQNAGYINSIEAGRSLPSMSSFFIICEYLGITPMEFFDIENQNPEEIREIIPYLEKLDNKQLEHLTAVARDMVKSK